ncbi:aromatic ring-hydroxylating oxygenase subunit alpha [Spirillospora sp. CA-294931]|uniref:aromatic ring-hydroxylating oxygenase subunit alpha n=1 Tax=Spirillospora sp. CA-294931 TaxID=3240042 RepID=UPI003D906D71
MSTRTTQATTTDEILAEMRPYLDDEPPWLSLPPRAFTDPGLYELERVKVWGRSWVLVAHADQLAATGDYVSLSIAGEPVLITRDEDGVLHAMSPVCRHRLMPVVESDTSGNAESFTCPYHLWKYRLDGRLAGATFMKGNPDFDPKTCRLPEFAVEEWKGLVYVNLDRDAESYAAHLDLVAGELANWKFEEMVQVASWTEDWDANWKLAYENGTENYHVIGLHPNTLDPFMPGRNDMWLNQVSPWLTHGRFPFAQTLPPETLPLTEEQRANATALLQFPSGGLITFGDQAVWVTFIPQSIDRTLVRFGVLMPAAMAEGADPEALREENTAAAAAINIEDQRGLERVQRTLGSRFAERGHLSPKEQPGVMIFYRTLTKALLSEDADWPGKL